MTAVMTRAPRAQDGANGLDTPSDSLARAIEKLRQGCPVVVLDSPRPAAAGELVLAAQAATPDAISFMVRRSSGYLRVAITDRRADALDLPLCAPELPGRHDSAYAVSVDARHGTSTGISAADRALTIMTLGNPDAVADDFTRPGHVVPLRTWSGGLRSITARGEAATDLTTLAGFTPVAALCAVVSTIDRTAIAAGAELRRFARQHSLAVITIEEIARSVLRPHLAHRPAAGYGAAAC